MLGFAPSRPIRRWYGGRRPSAAGDPANAGEGQLRTAGGSKIATQTSGMGCDGMLRRAVSGPGNA